MPPREMMGPLMSSVGVDAIYSFVIVFVSLLVYFGTKELYELSGHKGIKYFRLSFLFFAMAYVFRFLAQFLFLFLGFPRTFQSSWGILSVLASMLFFYASTSAILYLWTSVHWKWFKEKKNGLFLLHFIAIVITLLGTITRSVPLLSLIQLVIIISLVFSAYEQDKSKKSSQQVYLLYAFLAIFWALNVLDILIPRFFYPGQLIIYLASISTFLLLLYRVIKRTGAR
jgi:hypothetical protein